MKTLTILPEQKLILLVYHGDVTIQDVIEATRELVAHPHFSNEFDGVADYREAKVKFTAEELAGLTQSVKDQDMAHGTWCLLADGPLETAMMNLFKRNLRDLHPILVFSTVAAASKLLHRNLSDHLPETK